MIDLAHVIATITAFHYPAETDTLCDYIKSVCEFEEASLDVADKVLGDEEPSKEIIEGLKHDVPYFGGAVEIIINSFDEINRGEDFPIDKWRGLAQSLKIVTMCVGDSEWVEAYKHLFKPAVAV